MLENEPTGAVGDEPNDAQKNEVSDQSGTAAAPAVKKAAPRRRAASRPAGPPQAAAEGGDGDAAESGASAAVEAEAPAEKPARKTAARKTAAKKTASAKSAAADDTPGVPEVVAEVAEAAEAVKTTRTRARKKVAAAPAESDAADTGAAGSAAGANNADVPSTTAQAAPADVAEAAASTAGDTKAAVAVQADAEPASAPKRTRTRRVATAPAGSPQHHDDASTESTGQAAQAASSTSADASAKTRSTGSNAATSSATAKNDGPNAGSSNATGSNAPTSNAPTSSASADDDATDTAEAPAKRTRRKSAASLAAPFGAPQAAQSQSAAALAADEAAEAVDTDEETAAELTAAERARAVIAARAAGAPAPIAGVLFQAPDLTQAAAAKQRQQERREAAKAAREAAKAEQAGEAAAEATAETAADDEEHPTTPTRRTRERNRNKNRNRGDQGAANADELVSASAADTQAVEADAQGDDDEDDDLDDGLGSSSRRRRRRRRRTGADGTVEVSPDDPPNTVVKVREAREPRARQPRDRSKAAFGNDTDDVQGVRGSTRLEAKKQRRREGRDTGRRRAPLITEAEFLARRESVERVMVVRQTGDRTQIGVLEDGVLVEHYVNRATSSSYVGNVYLGKVQNVLPSMEAAFVDIGKGRNAVLYAGEVNFDAAGVSGQAKRIESVLKSGQAVLTQVTKDPIGHKGARLTSQVSLPGRYLVYVPEGTMTGISRKLPENERTRLKSILKQVVPEDAGVIVRTAAEGASEDELRRDVERLAAQWAEIQRRAQTSASSAPTLLYGEPDLTVRVVRDTFNEDFSKLIVSGDEAWDTIREYVDGIAPDLAPRLERWTSEQDVFSVHRIDEQLAKALDRKVWLPSGGSLVIDRTEAMIVVDVNTGKFTGSGGNLEETVTRNNIEAAEEIVRQLRLRDLGGIVVIDFIDMVLESNRDLVMRRLLECLGRDRTKHQVAEVTSLGLVQMTRKRVGQGLLEAFSETCDKCNGRGVLVHMEPVQIGKNEHFHEHESGPSNQSPKQKSPGNGNNGNGHGNGNGGNDKGHNGNGSNGHGDNGGGGKTADTVSNGSSAGDEDNGTEASPSGRSSRRKRRKSHGHESRQQFDVDGISDEFRDFVEDGDTAEGGPVTVSRVTEYHSADETHVTDAEVSVADLGEVSAADVAVAAANVGATMTAQAAPAQAAQVTSAATFHSESAEPAVTSSEESEAAVEAALGGSASVSVGGDTAAPKKRGLRVRRAAKRPAGPPAHHE